MARMRYLKPELWTDSKVVRMSPWARLLFIGSWNFALCEAGHLDDDAMALKLKVLPADPIDADEVLEEVIATGRIVRETLADGRSYLHIVNLGKHQKVDTRWATRCPYCTADGSKLTETPESSEESHPDSPQEGMGGDRRGETKTSSSSSTRSQGSRIPDDWEPSADLIAQMRHECPDVSLTAQHKRFVDHWRAQPGAKGRKSDWDATWRNWMRRAQDDATPRSGPRRGSTSDQRVASTQALKRPASPQSPTQLPIERAS